MASTSEGLALGEKEMATLTLVKVIDGSDCIIGSVIETPEGKILVQP